MAPPTTRTVEEGTPALRDIDIRAALWRHLRDEHTAPDTLIVDELGIACSTARVDVAMLNGSFSGFEIKSDVDSLSRLASQANTYDGVFDYITLVTGPRHFTAARAVVPKHWGLIRARASADGPVLRPVRQPKYNRHVDPMTLAMMLWRDELVEELKSRDAYRGLSSRPKGALWERLVAVTPVDELRTVVRERIKARGHWRQAPLTDLSGQYS